MRNTAHVGSFGGYWWHVTVFSIYVILASPFSGYFPDVLTYVNWRRVDYSSWSTNIYHARYNPRHPLSQACDHRHPVCRAGLWLLDWTKNTKVAITERCHYPSWSKIDGAKRLSFISCWHTSFKRIKTTSVSAPVSSQPGRGQTTICPDCKTIFALISEGARGWNTRPHRICLACYRARRGRRPS